MTNPARDATGGAGERATPLDRASVTPACLAALAEAGVIFLPAQELVRELTEATGGPMMLWPVFGLLFVAGTGLATRFRRSHWSSTAAIVGAIAVGVVQSSVSGRGGPFAAVGVVIVALAVTLRIVTLAAREWREPIAASILIGSMALLLEVAIGGGAPEPWPSLMGPVVVVFFLASLASRAASVRIEETGRPRRRLDRELVSRGTAGRAAMLALVSITMLLALVALGAGHGGAIRWVGLAILTLLGWILIAGVWLLSPLVVPLAWLASFLRIDLFEAFRRLVVNLGGAQARHAADQSVFGRVVAMLVLAGIVGLLIWSIRRRRRLRLGAIARRAAPGDEVAVNIATGPGERLRRALGIRRELPEVTVRRYYAEALLALERRGMPKPDHLTPGEFVPTVVRAFPTARAAYEDLTHAYEDVRYGDREITPERLARLGARRSGLLETLRSAARADEAAGATSV